MQAIVATFELLTYGGCLGRG